MQPAKRGVGLLFILMTLLAAVLGRAASAQLTAQEGSVVVEDRVVLTLRASVGSISPAERAGIVNARLERVLSEPALAPESLETRVNSQGDLLLTVGDFPLIEVSPADAAAEGTDLETVAASWAKTLRSALIEAKPLHRPKTGHKGISFMPLLIVSALAFLVPLFATRLGKLAVPVVVGEILVGIAIGRSGLDLVHYSTWLQFLAEFGFAFLMFLSGLEVNIGLLRPPTAQGEGRTKAGNPLAVALTSFGLTLLLAATVSHLLSAAGFIQRPWLMMLILSTTSLGIVVPVLKQRGDTATPYGQAILLAATIADFATMVLITLAAGFMSQGLTWRLFLVLALVAVFVAAVRLGSWAAQSNRVQTLLERAASSAQVPLRGSLALMLVFVALSEQLGTEVILGAFLAGLLLSLLMKNNGDKLRRDLEALGFGFFIPVFFIMVGVRFDLHALLRRPESLLLALLLVVGAFVIKIGAALSFRRLVSWRETFAAGFLLSARLSLIIAAAEIGVRLALLTETDRAAIICVALVTCIAAPMAYEALLPARKESDPSEPAAVPLSEAPITSH